MSLERSTQGEFAVNYDNLEAIPIEYSLPFAWGSVHVSKAANFAYNLQPVNGLSPDNYPQIPPRFKFDPEVNVWILAAGEVADSSSSAEDMTAEDPDANPEKRDSHSMSMWITGNGKEINLFTSFPNSSLAREGAFNTLREQMEQLDIDHRDESFMDELDDIETTKEIDQFFSQTFIHIACDFINQNLSAYIEAHYQEKDIKRQIRGITALGALGAAGAGYTAAGGPPTLMTGLVAASYGFAVTYFQRQHLKQYFLKDAAQLGAVKAFRAQRSASQIAHEIHDAYCTSDLS